MIFSDERREKAMRRRARGEAKARVREVRSILREHPFRVPEPVKVEISSTCDALEQARQANQHDALCQGLIKLDEQVQQHLSFVQKSTFREYAESIAVAVLIALLLRAFVVEAFKIPSGSMIPTMQVGDHIFVNKFLYGVRIPFTKIKFFEWRKPHRGEVIVFIYPRDPDKDFIKRVIGVEGDQIEVRNNSLTVNGKPVPRHPLPGPCEFWDFDDTKTKAWELKRCAKFEETLDGEKYETIDALDDYNKDFPSSTDPNPYIVPKGQVFVMGDNRNNSHDSRFWGTVPLENIKGKAMVIWWSAAGPGEERFWGVRWDRIGHVVD
jgi:signal peptidase I